MNSDGINRELEGKEITIGQRVMIVDEEHPCANTMGVVRAIDDDGDLLVQITPRVVITVRLIDVELA